MRCFTPLIEICDNTSQIKLDLGSCGVCYTPATALIIKKAGCPEYETVCEPQEPVRTCCGVYDYRPVIFNTKRVVEKPKPALMYPIHEIDTQGLSVFVLDGKLKTLGYGRYNAYLVNGDTPLGIQFDIDYIAGKVGLNAIELNYLQPKRSSC